MLTEHFSQQVLQWARLHGRTHFPWQQNKTPYTVWLSEIMLQQTQAATVCPYFEKFLQYFPTINKLAAASLDEVLHLWTGLGYYSRARNLHRTAQIISEHHDGKFPDSLPDLMLLPGIGRSTAGAILSLGFDKKASILDGNVKRVLTRFRGITEWPGANSVAKQLWTIAETYTPDKYVANYSQAMMDLGATVCTRTRPHCTSCPLQTDCVAFKKQLTDVIPGRKKKSCLPTRQVTLIALRNQNAILLEQRPATGAVWGRLWSLPEFAASSSNADIVAYCQKRFQYHGRINSIWPTFKHTFSHYHLEIRVAVIDRLKTNTQLKIMEDTGLIWYNLQQPPKLGLPSPIKKILQQLGNIACHA